ncbi:hypothetical protein FTO74_14260 [Granulicella sp. WH15]|uniref:hypothetical protein n=1 Tax=Granulicella sp. WH15 TaxID=2602070 RepID=UPI0013677116|nr:hypothetical protein [Granulicella sp. WH15]QHN04395.1 hypothetical protein FTO74_14260 [Granulicella sp. WH15]
MPDLSPEQLLAIDPLLNDWYAATYDVAHHLTKFFELIAADGRAFEAFAKIARNDPSILQMVPVIKAAISRRRDVREAMIRSMADDLKAVPDGL